MSIRQLKSSEISNWCYNSEIITKHAKILHEGVLIPITSHPLFSIYNGMKNRCYNKNLPTYSRWGGRGIRMSKSWYFSFQQFVEDIGPRPTKDHTVDRIDNNGNYNKLNCRWATKEEQNNNTKSNVNIEYKGEIRSLAQTAKFIGIDYHSLYYYFVTLEITDIELIINFVKHKTARQVSSNELKIIRSVFHTVQHFRCPIFKKEFPEENMVVDHLHSKHSKLLNIKNPGCIRGVIHRQANSFEGKIANIMIRLGLHKFGISLPELLRNMADYLEKPPLPFIHPNEKPKALKLMRSSYNELVKAYKGRKTIPPFRTDGKGNPRQIMTVLLQKLFDECKIEPGFYK